MGIDDLVLDTICVDEQDCALLAGTFNITSLFKAGRMSSNILAPAAPGSQVAS